MLHNIKHLTRALLPALLCFAFWACSGKEEGPDIPVSADDDYVTLELKVSILENTAPVSRAFPENEDGDFKGPVNQYESLRSLRVVIVRKSGSKSGFIEHNREVMLDPATGAIMNDNLQFKVAEDESKRVYLFGNEEIVDYDFSKLNPGALFPEEEIENLLITRKNNSYVIDNSSSMTASAPSYVPMSEFFDIEVRDSGGEGNAVQSENLFVTRSLIKFSFSFNVADDYVENGVKIIGVKVYGLANAGYYLPRATQYLPPKGEASDNPLGGRYIDKFETPADMTYSDYDFPFTIEAPEIKAGMSAEIHPAIYFPETKAPADGSIRVSVLLDNGLAEDFLVPLPIELTAIPRNTHMKINIRLQGTTISPEVVLLPYTGVNLNPDFGL